MKNYRIKYAYKDARIKPKFTITDHVISVILPVLSDKYNVTNDEEKIIKALENGMQLSSKVCKSRLVRKAKALYGGIFQATRGAFARTVCKVAEKPWSQGS